MVDVGAFDEDAGRVGDRGSDAIRRLRGQLRVLHHKQNVDDQRENVASGRDDGKLRHAILSPSASHCSVALVPFVSRLQPAVLPFEERHQFIFGIDICGIVTVCVGRWKPKLLVSEVLMIQQRLKSVQVAIRKNHVVLIIDQ